MQWIYIIVMPFLLKNGSNSNKVEKGHILPLNIYIWFEPFEPSAVDVCPTWNNSTKTVQCANMLSRDELKRRLSFLRSYHTSSIDYFFFSGNRRVVHFAVKRLDIRLKTRDISKTCFKYKEHWQMTESIVITTLSMCCIWTCEKIFIW